MISDLVPLLISQWLFLYFVMTVQPTKFGHFQTAIICPSHATTGANCKSKGELGCRLHIIHLPLLSMLRPLETLEQATLGTQ